MNMMNSFPSGSPGIGVPTSSGPPPMSAQPLPKAGSFVDTIRHMEGQIASYGPGPHTPQQKEELCKLSVCLQRARMEQQKIMSGNKMPEGAVGTTIPSMIAISQPTQNIRPVTMQAQPSHNGTSGSEGRVLDKRRLQELVKEVDPLEQLDDDVEDLLLQIADDFIENVVSSSCQIAKHRKSNTLEVKDVQLYLERNWNMWVPGFGSEEIRPFKKAPVTEAHKQRMALIRKTLKKY